MFLILLSSLALSAAPEKKVKRRGRYQNRDHMRPKAIEKGETLYQDLCWQCHGKTGLGDGPLAMSLAVPPPGLAGVQSGQHAEMIVLIQNGKGLMPGYAELIDKHDSKKILQWLSTLDETTGESKTLTK